MSDRRPFDLMKKKVRKLFPYKIEAALLETDSPRPDKNPGRVVSFLRLSKLFLSIHVGLAAASGYLFHPDGVVRTAIVVWIGVTLVAMAGSLLNNIQDRIQDQAFTRTQWRFEALASTGLLPLLKGAGLMGVLGLMLVVDASRGFWPAAMVLAGLFIYNGIYTPLKKKSHLALIPGALCGMSALLAGWMVAGGSPMDKGALSAALVMGVWQVPHSMVQNLTHADEMRKGEYPSITKLFEDPDLAFIILMWVMLYNLSLYHLIFMAPLSEWAMFLLFVNAGFLIPFFAHTLFVMKRPWLSFICLNVSLQIYFVALMIS